MIYDNFFSSIGSGLSNMGSGLQSGVSSLGSNIGNGYTAMTNGLQNTFHDMGMSDNASNSAMWGTMGALGGGLLSALNGGTFGQGAMMGGLGAGLGRYMQHRNGESDKSGSIVNEGKGLLSGLLGKDSKLTPSDYLMAGGQAMSQNPYQDLSQFMPAPMPLHQNAIPYMPQMYKQVGRI
jgi:hypothetical protein